jgi:hypothetical protein
MKFGMALALFGAEADIGGADVSAAVDGFVLALPHAVRKVATVSTRTAILGCCMCFLPIDVTCW